MFRSAIFKGYFFTIIGAIALGNVYIFSKIALNEIHLAQFGTYWFGFGLIWNFLYVLSRKKRLNLRGISRKSLISVVIIGLIELVATSLFYITIRIIENPAIVSFIANLIPFFVALIGISFLKERFNFIELAGMGLTLFGSILISYQRGNSIGDFFIKGAELVVLFSLLFALSIIKAKRTLKKVDPAILSFIRILFLFVFSLVMLIALNESMIISHKAIKHIFIGSLLGPFLNSVTIYIALKYIEASRATMLRSIRSVFVLIAAYIYFSTFPLLYQLIGGSISILGVIIMSYGQTLKGKSLMFR
ncbi:DMT family transporter [Bacteroidota bacterium]